MTVWPSREEWIADAERSVRHSCYPSERVSERLDAWTDAAQREQLGHLARGARLAAGRAARAIEKPHATLADVSSELHRIEALLRVWRQVEARAASAAEEALAVAIAQRIAYRQTDEAWQREVERRAEIDRLQHGETQTP